MNLNSWCTDKLTSLVSLIQSELELLMHWQTHKCCPCQRAICSSVVLFLYNSVLYNAPKWTKKKEYRLSSVLGVVGASRRVLLVSTGISVAAAAPSRCASQRAKILVFLYNSVLLKISVPIIVFRYNGRWANECVNTCRYSYRNTVFDGHSCTGTLL